MGSSSGQSGSIGLGFAIPIDTVKRITSEIIDTGSSTTPMIGVQLDTAYTGKGAKIGAVTPAGPAEAAGLLPGDIITRVNDRFIDDPTGLVVAIRSKAPGDTLDLTITRDGKTLGISTMLEASPS
jgi:putative serine protease PepD